MGTGGDGRAGGDGGGGDGGDGGSVDAACVPLEVCDHADNDCDGSIDEGFNLDMDPANCGDCGHECSLPGAAGTCFGGCAYSCLPGYHDLDDDLGAPGSNGCEYPCLETNGGVEACDFADNDCNGSIDETFHLDTDESNCGGCGRPCLVLHATPLCTDGMCGYTACDPGFADVLSEVAGCEYACPVLPTTAETCDGVDQDCDGNVDELPIAGLGADCVDPGFEATGDTGACEFGRTSCLFGVPYCAGYVRPQPEICDGLDNDCDGAIDDGFDTMSDPRHCGADCAPCELDHAIEGCVAGGCTVLACESGFVDADADPTTGCEYECTRSGPEVCDGVDNDCDRLVDTLDPDLIRPANFCLTAGACAGEAPVCGTAVCDPAVRWRCIYGGAAEEDLCGNLPLQEVLCDDIDGDCDGRVDEAYPSKGLICGDDGVGICRSTGIDVCNATHDDVRCDITTPGVTPTAEACNDEDDDCDGSTDEDAPAEMVDIGSSGMDFWIYKYEASRPDASASDPGSADHRTCSRAGALPWTSVTHVEAAAACALSGKRLCTEAEWQEACEGAGDLVFPYGDPYGPTTCNGNDFDGIPGGQDDDVLLASGSRALCTTPTGVFDLSGNAKEWTSTMVSTTPVAFSVRGGAYDSIEPGLTCQFDFVSAVPDFCFPNLGFRCCSTTGP